MTDVCQRAHGLSPPTRGIRAQAHSERQGNGSIPAYAGDPSLRRASYSALRVYPRLRGGSVNPGTPLTDDEGLSPPTRGIRNKGGGRDA